MFCKNSGSAAVWVYFHEKNDTNVHTFRENGHSLTIDSTTKTPTGSDISTNTDAGIRLYVANDYALGFKLFSFGMTQTDGVTIEFETIPAKRNSDNSVGLYDITNDVFYRAGDWGAGPAM